LDTSKSYSTKWPNTDLKDFSRNIIGEVISKIFLEKVRKWNLDEYPDFEDFIVGVVDSHINNTLKKKSKESNAGDNEYLLDRNVKAEPDAMESITTNELRKQVFDELETAGADDDELLILECLADGIETPADIKKALGLSDEDFHNIWRRFKRKRKVIQQKLAAYGY
jgi:hypothetical protein